MYALWHTYYRALKFLLLVICLLPLTRCDTTFTYEFAQGYIPPSSLPTTFSDVNSNSADPGIDCSNARVLRNGLGFTEDEYCSFGGRYEMDSSTFNLYTWLYIYDITDIQTLFVVLLYVSKTILNHFIIGYY